MTFLAILLQITTAGAAVFPVVRFQTHPSRLFQFTQAGLFMGDPASLVGVVEAEITQVEKPFLNSEGFARAPFLFFSTPHLLYVLTPERAFPVAQFLDGVNSFSAKKARASEPLRSVTLKSGAVEQSILVRLSSDHVLSVISPDGLFPRWSVRLNQSSMLPGIEGKLIDALRAQRKDIPGSAAGIGYSSLFPGNLTETLDWIRLQTARTGLDPTVLVELLARNSDFNTERVPAVQLDLIKASCSMVVN